jgi:hypothetical protein
VLSGRIEVEAARRWQGGVRAFVAARAIWFASPTSILFMWPPLPKTSHE